MIIKFENPIGVVNLGSWGPRQEYTRAVDAGYYLAFVAVRLIGGDQTDAQAFLKLDVVGTNDTHLHVAFIQGDNEAVLRSLLDDDEELLEVFGSLEFDKAGDWSHKA